MRMVPRPSRTAEEAFKVCISKYRRTNKLKAPLDAAVEAIGEASSRYVVAADASTLWNLKEDDFQVAGVTSDDMEGVYDRLVDNRHPARLIYDEILAAAEVCPSCGHNKPSTLDHFLPKGKYPALAVDPSNLVPACKDCNFIKLSQTAERPEDEGFHPYFGVMPNEPWLSGRVLETSPAAVEYYVDPPTAWNDVLKARVRNHFSAYGLAELYAVQAGTLISGIRRYVNDNLYSTGGAVAVHSYLRDMAESYADPYVNCWQAAAYRTLSGSDWYCDGGFRA